VFLHNDEVSCARIPNCEDRKNDSVIFRDGFVYLLWFSWLTDPYLRVNIWQVISKSNEVTDYPDEA